MTKTLRLKWSGPFTLNNQRVGAHWRTHTAENTMLHQWAATASRDQQTTFTGPVRIEALMTQPAGRLPDADSIALATKYVIDGLQTGGVFPNDGPEYVRQVTYHAPEKTPNQPRSLIVLVTDNTNCPKCGR